MCCHDCLCFNNGRLCGLLRRADGDPNCAQRRTRVRLCSWVRSRTCLVCRVRPLATCTAGKAFAFTDLQQDDVSVANDLLCRDETWSSQTSRVHGVKSGMWRRRAVICMYALQCSCHICKQFILKKSGCLRGIATPTTPSRRISGMLVSPGERAG